MGTHNQNLKKKTHTLLQHFAILASSLFLLAETKEWPQLWIITCGNILLTTANNFWYFLKSCLKMEFANFSALCLNYFWIKRGKLSFYKISHKVSQLDLQIYILMAPQFCIIPILVHSNEKRLSEKGSLKHYQIRPLGESSQRFKMGLFAILCFIN